MKRLSLLTLLCLTCFCAHAQFVSAVDTIDQARLVVMYELRYCEDSLHLDRVQTEKMMLEIGDKLSLFQSYNAFRLFEKFRKMEREGSLDAFLSQPMYLEKDEIASFQYRIFKNHPVGKLTYTDGIAFSGSFSFEEALHGIVWEMAGDTLTVAGHPSQKATCDYGGRHWEAWFTEELPFSDGPYMFCGLPGLIVKIEDTKGHYRFEMLSAEKPAECTPILWKRKDYVKTTKKGFFKASDNAQANIIENVMERSTPVDGDRNNQQKKLYQYQISKNNPIELDRK